MTGLALSKLRLAASSIQNRDLRIEHGQDGSRVWRIVPAAFPDEAIRLDAWIADGSASLVKKNAQRSVYRIERSGQVYYAKVCRVNGIRAWGRELIRPAKARLEFDQAIALRSRGIPTVEPVAYATGAGRWPSESVLITRELTGASPLDELLDRIADDRSRRAMAAGLARFFAAMHEAGVTHPDPHPGNLFVTLTENEWTFHLLDVHAVSLTAALTVEQSHRNLVLLNRWFSLRCHRADRLRFWKQYVLHRTEITWTQNADHLARECERRTQRSNLVFWRSRFDRYRTENREYRRVRVGSVRGMVMKSVAGDQVREIAKNPDALFRTATKVLKNSRSSMVVECELMTEAGPRSVIAKRVNVKSFGSLLKNLVRPTQALRAWRNGQSLHDRWLPTPRPLLMLHRYRFGVPREGYLFVECVPDALGLTEALHAATGQTAVVRRWVDALARILRLMHDRGMSHGDLKAANVLIAGASRDLTTYHPVLIDLAGATAALAISTANRQRDLMRLAASCSSQVSRTDCLRFLKRYLDVPPQYGKDWKAWWRTIDRAVGRKQAKNQSRGRPVW